VSEAQQKQTYDNVIKRLFERHMGTMVQLFLEEKPTLPEPGRHRVRRKGQALTIDRIEELNIEALLPPRRHDRVYRLLYQGRPHVVEVEIETAPNSSMAIRSLIYHALLLEKYGAPVVSLIIYPFSMPIVYPPLLEENGDGHALTFHFRPLPLWTLDARAYFEREDRCMYALLPAMGGVTREMLFQTLARMVKYQVSLSISL
jgi:hypothetical protein